MLYPEILSCLGRKKMLAMLIDPDKHPGDSLGRSLEVVKNNPPDFILVGGSLVTRSIDEVITEIKIAVNVPVFLFPGNLLQLSGKADGVLLLSLISGRNPEYLIGNHVLAAPFIKNSGLEVIPTGYILVETGSKTSVEYISNTTAIPAGKVDIVASTALAGEMLGLKLIYLEGGSGADKPINKDMIREVKRTLTVPLAVGGGIRTSQQAHDAYSAGADIVVVGNALEENPELLIALLRTRDNSN